MHFIKKLLIKETFMTLQNRWGDNVEKDGGLLGPDGQPLSSAPKTPAEEPAKEAAEPQLDFFNYIASLGFQTMIFLGEMPNPMTNQVEKNLKQAKFLIDTLIICAIRQRVFIQGRR